ncbi:MAG: hypothetical protein AAB521_01030 [Patescibacteria group bacterium]
MNKNFPTDLIDLSNQSDMPYVNIDPSRIKPFDGYPKAMNSGAVVSTPPVFDGSDNFGAAVFQGNLGQGFYPATASGTSVISTSYPSDNMLYLEYAQQVGAYAGTGPVSNTEISDYNNSSSSSETTIQNDNNPKTGLSTKTKFFLIFIGAILLGVIANTILGHNQFKFTFVNPLCIRDCDSNIETHEDYSQYFPINLPISQ